MNAVAHNSPYTPNEMRQIWDRHSPKIVEATSTHMEAYIKYLSRMASIPSMVHDRYYCAVSKVSLLDAKSGRLGHFIKTPPGKDHPMLLYCPEDDGVIQAIAQAEYVDPDQPELGMEIGFSVMPEYEHHHVGTAMFIGVINVAYGYGHRMFCIHTDHGHRAVKEIARNCGFGFIGDTCSEVNMVLHLQAPLF